ncbi:hypothetical protein [Leptospira wolbachii]|uniref:hypothetical protein n=1 Tax=Leptospira wolbachii TaxID=29511 RepID=UPI0012EBFBF9|nr:hypothetical protein [Leptospira wolbachii]
MYVDTSYTGCNKHSLSENIEFSDPIGDVKIGFLKPPPSNLSFQELAGGKISISKYKLTLSLDLQSLSDTVIINNVPQNNEDSEFFLGYQFYGTSDLTVGINHLSNGDKKSVFWNHFQVTVYENFAAIASCGNSIQNQNTLTFNCDKTLIPALQSLNEKSEFNAEVTDRSSGEIYKDCY